MSIQPCRPKSDSALPEAIWAQFRPKNLNQKAIPAHDKAHFSSGNKSALANLTVLAMIKGAKLDSKIGLYFIHQNGPIFRAKTDLSDLESTKNLEMYKDWFYTSLLKITRFTIISKSKCF